MFFGIPQHQFELLAPQLRVFLSLAHGFHNDVPIVRANQQDKEYHFQNWVKRRIQAAGLAFQEQGRHGYPDFILEDHPCGFEVKGLAHPGRVADFDCNSQLPLAQHDGRSIFYIFGRYPQTTEQEYAVFDLVLCSASFLNAETENTNTNQSFRGAGSYGDILIRDRRMYVCATPYALAAGTSAQATLILEDGVSDLPEVLEAVGQLQRSEAQEVVTGYSFDLRQNLLSSEKGPNPNAGRPHSFVAYKIRGQGNGPVTLTPRNV
ncbi:MAG: hypothetical protein ACK4S6_17340 [Roseateles asaccharophilus]|uniref:hypothetical protein n=1 Tax=Roseateles asaccharophilus TaxID=582607 RepID=UPI00391C5A21